MKKITILFSAILMSMVVGASAQSLMLDFGQTTVASPYLTTSPGHDVGGIPLTDTTWNKIISSSPVTSLSFADGAAATGITLTMGQEATGGSNVVSFSTAITNVALAGTGGSAWDQQSLLGTGSIYGDNTSSTAAGRDGFFGGGTATDTGAAIGLRIDGLAVGDYVVYVMARNTNSSATPAAPMNVYASTGASLGTFDFNSLTAVTQANTTYTSVGYTGEYNMFDEGNNYVAIQFSIEAGQSLFLAIDGADATMDRRGFLNAVQIVAVPEPGVGPLVAIGLGALLFVRHRRRA